MKGLACGSSLVQAFGTLSSLQNSYDLYQQDNAKHSGLESRNPAQKALRESFDPFFERLHDSVKKIGKAVESMKNLWQILSRRKACY